MLNFGWLISGGFAKGHRTQILGVSAAISAVALWAVGDATFSDLIAQSHRLPSFSAASALPPSAQRSIATGENNQDLHSCPVQARGIRLSDH